MKNIYTLIILIITAAVIVSCSNPLNEKFDENEYLSKIDELQKEEHITKDDKFRFEKYYQLHNKKSISLSDRTYKQILKDPELAVSAISSFTKQKNYAVAKQLLEKTKELFDTRAWDYYAESVLLDENILNIVQISKGKPIQTDSRNKGDILQKAIASSSPKWSTDTKQEGYVTNLSTTLTLSVKIKVTFTIEKVTKVSLMFLSKTVRKTVYDSKEIIINNLKPGESKPFSAYGSAKQDYYEGIGGTSARITDIKVEAILISPRFNIVRSDEKIETSRIDGNNNDRPVSWSCSMNKIKENEYELIFKVIIEPGWHIYDIDGTAIPSTRISFNSNQDYYLKGDFFSESQTIYVYENNFEKKMKLYMKEAIFKQNIILNDLETKVTGSIVFMVGDEDKCYPPKEMYFEFIFKK